MKNSFRSFNFIRSLNLRYKVGLFFFLPVMLILLALLAVDYFRDVREIREQIEVSASQLGQVTLGSFRHAMLTNDSATIALMVQDVAAQKSIRKVWIVDLNGMVGQSSVAGEIGNKVSTNEAGCFECHQYAPADRPQTIILDADPSTLRITVPIPNDPDCVACHSVESKHLGMLLIDASMAEAQKKLSLDIFSELLLSILILVACMLLAFILVQWLIVRRVEVIHTALVKLGTRDFSTRITEHWRTQDELTQLADHFNQIAANFESLQAKHDERDRVRVQAIIEERERIARELHDGVAQFLGYLSAKVGAIQLALKNDNAETAIKNLEQVEESIRSQSIEVRSAIVGLKMSGDIELGLAHSVREFVDQCNRLDDLPLELEVVGDVESIELDHETALQLLRILQEAVSNIRKHSHATEASIRLEKQPGKLAMIIRDNGIGFDLLLRGLERRGHFGMQIMVERAHAIGAQIEIKSSPGQGAQVIVTLAV